MNKIVGATVTVGIFALFLLGLMAAGYSPGQITVGGDALIQVRDPRIDAQATRIVQESSDAARERAIQAQTLEAQRDKAKTEAEATEKAAAALVVRNVLVALGIGLGALVLIVGGAYAIVTWLHKNAASVKPNEAGLYPLIVSRGLGQVIIHDPNRNAGSAAVYQVSTPIEQWMHTLAALRRFFVTGQPPDGLALPAPQAKFPQDVSEHTVAQITTQAQAGQTMAALAHGARGNPRVQRQAARRVVHYVNDAAAFMGEQQPQLPPVTVIAPGDYDQFKQTYVLNAAGADDDMVVI